MISTSSMLSGKRGKYDILFFSETKVSIPLKWYTNELGHVKRDTLVKQCEISNYVSLDMTVFFVILNQLNTS